MAFLPKTGTEQDKFGRVKMAASTTIVAGQALAYTSGYVRPATSSDTEVRYVAMDSLTSGSGSNPYIRVCRTEDVTFIADTANATAQTLCGTKIDLTDAVTLNDAATTNKVFFVEDLNGATTAKQVIGRFVMKTA